jgi:hypothetical protein
MHGAWAPHHLTKAGPHTHTHPQSKDGPHVLCGGTQCNEDLCMFLVDCFIIDMSLYAKHIPFDLFMLHCITAVSA